MIKELLATLSKDKLKDLMQAFNSEMPYILVLDNGSFLAVHYASPPNGFIVTEQKGCWMYGQRV